MIAALKERDPDDAAAALAAPPALRRAARARAVSGVRRASRQRWPAASAVKIAVADLTLDYVEPGDRRRATAPSSVSTSTSRPTSSCACVGPSGCGKSTLLVGDRRLPARRPQGSIPMDGRPITGPGRRARRRVPGIRAAAVDERARQRGAGPEAARHAARQSATRKRGASWRSPTCTASSTSIRTSCPAA